MSLTNTQVMTLIGFRDTAHRNALIGDFLSSDLEGLQHLSEEDVKEACSSYVKKLDGSFPVILSTLQKQHLKALMLWVKDQVRLQRNP